MRRKAAGAASGGGVGGGVYTFSFHLHWYIFSSWIFTMAFKRAPAVRQTGFYIYHICVMYILFWI